MTCTNCSGTNISAKSITIDRQTGKEVLGTKLIMKILGGLLGALGALMIIAMFSLVIRPVADTNPLQILPGSLIFLMLPVYLIINYRSADKVKQFNNTCADCGQQWEEREKGGQNLIPCAACGEYDVVTTSLALDPKTGKPLSRLVYEFLGWIAILGGLVVIVLGFWAWGESGFLYLLAAGAAFAAGGGQQVSKYMANRVDVHNCATCGHEWQASKGAVLPS
jgi:hypothetical protein